MALMAAAVVRTAMKYFIDYKFLSLQLTEQPSADEWTF
jgi:hypothetical protein